MDEREPGRPPGIPDEAWRRWTTRSKPGAPERAPGGGTRRIAVGNGDAQNGPCDLCGADRSPFSWLTVDGGQPYAACAPCRATLAQLQRLVGGAAIQLTVAD